MIAHAGPYGALHELRVADAMHAGLVSCPPDTPVRAVARMMATYRVHAVLVHPHGAGRAGEAWGVVSDTDLLAAARAGDAETQTAGRVAGTPVLTVSPDDRLSRAAQLMLEHEVSHVLVVLGPRPVGVVSTLDVARAFAGFPERHPITT
jgi:CBS domain-containing protein